VDGKRERHSQVNEGERKVGPLDQLTMMRRANGELFTLMLKGRAHLALWRSLQSALYYKARNPELLVFSPALVASPFGQKSLTALQREDVGLFLLTDTGRARLGDGRQISWHEIKDHLPASSLASATASHESFLELSLIEQR
jgi:hypothetical protein